MDALTEERARWKPVLDENVTEVGLAPVGREDLRSSDGERPSAPGRKLQTLESDASRVEKSDVERIDTDGVQHLQLGHVERGWERGLEVQQSIRERRERTHATDQARAEGEYVDHVECKERPKTE